MVNEIVQTQIASQVRTLDWNDGGGEISPRRLVRKDGKYFFLTPVVSPRTICDCLLFVLKFRSFWGEGRRKGLFYGGFVVEELGGET
ncbi:MAG: hypothetical protein JNL95_06245 [Chitinophagales bacterium]|nr:hypothetical protein [Chitinophagales bacterium]